MIILFKDPHQDNMRPLCCLFLSCLSITLAEMDEDSLNIRNPPTTDSFDILFAQHERTCGVYTECDTTADYVHMDTTCCGFCMCESKCLQYGSCCLGMYASFEHAFQTVQTTR